MTLAELTTKRDSLIGRIADATKRLQSGDQSIEYQTVQDMERALRLLDTEIARASGAVTSAFGTVVGREGL